MDELKRVIEDSEIMQEDDALWPPPDRVGRQVMQGFLSVHIFIQLKYNPISNLDEAVLNIDIVISGT